MPPVVRLVSTANSSCSASMYCSVRSSAGCAAHPEILNLRSFGFRVLHNHRGAIAAMDFFTVPTVTFNLLYCFFIISHDRRRILHFNVTRHPNSAWIVQQLREAFPYDSAPRFLLLDHDAKYGLEVPASMRSLNMTPVRTSIRSPWQNGV